MARRRARQAVDLFLRCGSGTSWPPPRERLGARLPKPGWRGEEGRRQYRWPHPATYAHDRETPHQVLAGWQALRFLEQGPRLRSFQPAKGRRDRGSRCCSGRSLRADRRFHFAVRPDRAASPALRNGRALARRASGSIGGKGRGRGRARRRDRGAKSRSSHRGAAWPANSMAAPLDESAEAVETRFSCAPYGAMGAAVTHPCRTWVPWRPTGWAKNSAMRSCANGDVHCVTIDQLDGAFQAGPHRREHDGLRRVSFAVDQARRHRRARRRVWRLDPRPAAQQAEAGSSLRQSCCATLSIARRKKKSASWRTYRRSRHRLLRAAGRSRSGSRAAATRPRARPASACRPRAPWPSLAYVQ